MQQHFKIFEWPLNLSVAPWEVPAIRASILKALAAPQLLGTGGADQPSFYELVAGPLVQFQARSSHGAYQLVVQGLGRESRSLKSALKELPFVYDGKKMTLQVGQTHCRAFRLRDDERWYHYRLFNYQPLRTTDVQEFQMTPEKTRLALLAGKVAGHLTQFYRLAAGRTLVPHLADLQLIRQKEVRVQGCPLLGFDLAFTTNVFLPEYVGLGPGARRGLGVVRRERQAMNLVNGQGDTYLKYEKLLPNTRGD